MLCLLNVFASLCFISYYYCLEIYAFNLRYNFFTSFILVTILLVSSCVILNCIDYLSTVDSSLFLVYILLFQFTMLSFILTYDLIVAFFYWDLLGIISYLLVNFWSSRVNSGLKAIVYNKIGDCCFLIVLSLAYSYLSFVNYSSMVPFSIVFNLFVGYISCLKASSLIYLVLLIICFTKSAQLPFSSWLLNAMSAPTPVSALLHSYRLTWIFNMLVFKVLFIRCYSYWF